MSAKARAWWQARPLREKLLLAGAATAALIGLGDALLTAPLEKRLQRTRAETQGLAARLQTLASPKADGPRQQEAALREQLGQARAESAALHRRLAEGARLPETLRAITATVGSARVLELDLSGDVDGGGTAQPATPAAAQRLYRLPITLKVSGSYAELQLLLAQIERHAQALQWTSLALDNAEWPAIQLTLKAYVLSTSPRWGALS